MKIQRVHILASILAFVFSGAVVCFTSQNQNYLNVDESEVNLPEVFEQSTGLVELALQAEPNTLKAGEKSKIKLILTNKNTQSVKDIIYKVSVPEQFSIVKDSIPANGLINQDFGIFLSGVEVNDNDIVFYMVNYPSLNTDTFLINGLELISFDVIAKDNAITLDYIIGFDSEFENQFLDISKVNVLGKVTNATLSVIDSGAIVLEKPVISAYVPTMYNERYKFQGTKEEGTGIKVGGQSIVPESDTLTWEFDISLTKLGKNIFKFTAYKGLLNSEELSLEITRHGLADLRIDTDSNGNSTVDARDLAVFAGSFYKYRNDPDGKIEDTDPSGYRLSDMNKVVSGTATTYGDGKIDAKDISEFVKNWKKSYKY